MDGETEGMQSIMDLLEEGPHNKHGTCDIPVSCLQKSLSIGFSCGWTYWWNSASISPDRVFNKTAGNSTAQNKYNRSSAVNDSRSQWIQWTTWATSEEELWALTAHMVHFVVAMLLLLCCDYMKSDEALQRTHAVLEYTSNVHVYMPLTAGINGMASVGQ